RDCVREAVDDGGPCAYGAWYGSAYGNPRQPVAVDRGPGAAARRAGPVWAALVAPAVVAGGGDVCRRVGAGLAGASGARGRGGTAADRHGGAGVVTTGCPPAVVGFHDRGQLLVAARRRRRVRRVRPAVRLGPGSDPLGAAGDQPRSARGDRSRPRPSLVRSF